MDLGLQGKVAIVCAASQGLGKAAAAGFHREGAHVVICSRNEERLRAAAAEIAAQGDASARVVPVTADVANAADITRMVETTITELGRVDILITNTGGPPVAPFESLDDAAWERGHQVALMNVVRSVRAVLPYMRKQRWGRIVNISSIAAKQPVNDLVISSTLRSGLFGLSRIVANLYAKEGILMNNVAPGYILTARQREISESRAAQKGVTVDKYMDDLARDIPMGRYGKPEELADAILFLCSERASYITGAVLSVDGGLSRGLT